MPLQDPVAVFTASSNVRAQALCHLLAQSGVEAYVTEDLSLVGLWMGGTIPGIHSPKIWVERADAVQAAAILRQHAQREAELQAQPTSAAEAGRVQVVCEECGQSAAFLVSQRGSVQECPHCGSYLDVETDEEDGDWEGDDEDSSAVQKNIDRCAEPAAEAERAGSTVFRVVTSTRPVWLLELWRSTAQ